MILKVNKLIKSDLDSRGFTLANPNHCKNANCTVVFFDKKSYILTNKNDKTFKSICFDCKDSSILLLSLIDYDESIDYRQWFVSENNKWFHCNSAKFSHIMAKWSYPTSKNWRRASLSEIKKYLLNEQ